MISLSMFRVNALPAPESVATRPAPAVNTRSLLIDPVALNTRNCEFLSNPSTESPEAAIVTDQSVPVVI